MATVVRMPAALAGVTEGAIQTWIASAGQTIAAGDPLAEIETEKAVVEYGAEVGGTVARLLAEPGENIAVGAPIAVILAAGESDDAVDAALAEAGVGGGEAPAVTAAPEPETAPEPAAPAAAVPATTPAQTSPAAAQVVEPPSGVRVFASPIVRRLAKEHGVDLAGVTGSGPDGRIVRRDLDGVQAASAAGIPAAASRPAPTAVPLTGMRRAIARRLTESKTTVPHFYVTAHCHVDALIDLRGQVNATAEHKISLNDFVLKAVAGALRAVPAANAVWGGDVINRFDQVDLAVAVAVEGGLLTPVLRGVDTMTLTQVAAAVADAAERARAGKLRQDELEGGSFSVSNLGMYGVDEFSAILNPPQSGILAVGAAKERAIVVDGQLAVGNVMTVTLSADHRVIDGAVAAEWMKAFVTLIENPVGILIGRTGLRDRSVRERA
jgi:pyruvate dehydrogenase E2 component (dihydrolipoamide acetyltransferase)